MKKSIFALTGTLRTLFALWLNMPKCSMLILLLISLILSISAPNKSAQGGEQYAGFAVSSASAPYLSNYSQYCVNEFGANWRQADWLELEEYYNNGGNLEELVSVTGLTGWVMRDGDTSYDSTRDYFVAYHNHNPPSNFLVHDDIDNYYISLGSWNTARQVLCRNPQSKPCPAETVINDTAKASGNTALTGLRAFRDHFLSKGEYGKSFIRQYYQHSAEGIQLMMKHPEWIIRSAGLLEKIQPALLNAADTGALQLDESMLQEIMSLMDEVKPYTSPELSQFIDTVQSRLLKRQAMTP